MRLGCKKYYNEVIDRCIGSLSSILRHRSCVKVLHLNLKAWYFWIRMFWFKEIEYDSFGLISDSHMDNLIEMANVCNLVFESHKPNFIRLYEIWFLLPNIILQFECIQFFAPFIRFFLLYVSEIEYNLLYIFLCYRLPGFEVETCFFKMVWDLYNMPLLILSVIIEELIHLFTFHIECVR